MYHISPTLIRTTEVAAVPEQRVQISHQICYKSKTLLKRVAVERGGLENWDKRAKIIPAEEIYGPRAKN